jgi:hypothetical protein
MDRQFNQIDATLARVAQLARELRADPDRDVSRSIAELLVAFATRNAMEPGRCAGTKKSDYVAP